MPPKFTNKLIQESSPYLKQHAHNPVNWYPWSDEAISLAKQSDLPILVSIGYSACHWCHVMEHESFEDEAVADFMNANFINIKIDREERPDLDHIYMEAVQSIAGGGGWPLNVFLTPDLKPFYGGTYFPPKQSYNLVSWSDLLSQLSTAWKTRRSEIEEQAQHLYEHMNGNSRGLLQIIDKPSGPFTLEDFETVISAILKTADKSHGGFGRAPKFPQTFTIQFLLMFGFFGNSDESLQQAQLSLKKLIRGGIYDHLAGGMCRYSTDTEWLAPHFEKMLYDNALLLMVLADAYTITGDEEYHQAINKTIRFLQTEMKDPEGGYYSALDADSEGVEGKYYIWQKEEIDNLLGNESELFCKFYGVTGSGNWEHSNILSKYIDVQTFTSEHNLPEAEFRNDLERWESILLKQREKRIRPGTDDKILLGWNALLVTAYCKCYAATGNNEYFNEAVSLNQFLLEVFAAPDGGLHHTYKEGVARFPAFLEDYAFFIQSCISLQEITGDQSGLINARELTELVIRNFSTTSPGIFYFTAENQKDILMRKIEYHDGAVPSGNSIMIQNLLYLSVVFDKPEWKESGLKVLEGMKELWTKYPGSFGLWCSESLKQWLGIMEIAVVGTRFNNILVNVLKIYLPNKVLQSNIGEQNLPLLRGKNQEGETLIYVCKNYACKSPMHSVEELKSYLKNDMIRNIPDNI